MDDKPQAISSLEATLESEKLCNERGVPRVKRWEMINVGIVKNVGSKVVRDGGLCTRAKELAFGLKIREFGGERIW